MVAEKGNSVIEQPTLSNNAHGDDSQELQNPTPYRDKLNLNDKDLQDSMEGNKQIVEGENNRGGEGDNSQATAEWKGKFTGTDTGQENKEDKKKE
ncbi:hypothetical protein HAX54_052834 [Datura stramonium]|uniref:Uncharacterized protein n=1 Tax=Datura stramonium TaxID=4076 RepID=A0ABS8WNW4_DATST|nr:hypothetical protein [Datura stramonium]